MPPPSIWSKGFRKVRRGLKKVSQVVDDTYAATEGYLTD